MRGTSCAASSCPCAPTFAVRFRRQQIGRRDCTSRVRITRSDKFWIRRSNGRHRPGGKKTGTAMPSPFLIRAYPINQVQVITPLVMSQVFADCECVAVALQEAGGPALLVATIVTFCDGVNPWRGAAYVAVPPKYAPLLSAAYCSS